MLPIVLRFLFVYSQSITPRAAFSSLPNAFSNSFFDLVISATSFACHVVFGGIGTTVFAQWDFPLHYKNKRYVPPIKFVENQNNLGNTSVTHGMTLYRKGKCLGANSLISRPKYFGRQCYINDIQL
jgi:hypothetical protein